MKDFMPEKNQIKKLTENVLAVSSKARNAKEKNSNIINATAGSYYDESGKIKVFKCIDDAFKNPNYNKYLSYASIQGSDDFFESVKSWVLGDNYKDIYNDYNINVIATPGGTGAISLSVGTYLEEGDTVLLPNVMWPAYTQIITNQMVSYIEYDLYDELGNFNLASLEEKAVNVLKNNEKVFIVVNDPCHNPTGFVMSHEEYINLTKLLNKISIYGKIVLLMDIAYLDYATQKGNLTRNYFEEFKNLNDKVMVLYAFSASKTFGIYGLRLGALIQLTRSHKESELFKNASSYFARSTWSNSTHLGISILTNTLCNKENKEYFIKELSIASDDLEVRSTTFIDEIKKYNVPFAPYKNGFFVLLLIDDIKFDILLEERGAYGCRFKSGYRISLASINKEESLRLATMIGEIYKNIKK